MADTDNPKLVFDAEVRDNTKKGIDTVKKSVEGVAKNTGNVKREVTAAQTAMRAFNEKSEKGRQVINVMGTAVGGLAGQVTGLAGSFVYYGGTLSYIIAMFGAWEIVIMAALAAIGGLVYLVMKESDEEKRWRDEREKSDRVQKELNQRLREYYDALLNITKFDKDKIKAQREMNVLTEQQRDIQERLNDANVKLNKSQYGTFGYRSAKNAVNDLTKAMLENVKARAPLEGFLREIDVVAKATDAKTKKDEADREKKRKAEERAREAVAEKKRIAQELEVYEQKITDDALAEEFELLAQEDEYYKEERSLAQDRFVEQIRKGMEAERQATKEHLDLMKQIRDEDSARVEHTNASEIRRREEEAKAAMEAERDAMQQRMEYAAMGADAIVGLFQSIARGNAEQIAETLKAMAIESLARAAWHGIMAIASGFLGNPLGVAKHSTLAGLYAGFAATYGAGAGLASSLGGGGGGGGAGPTGGGGSPGYSDAGTYGRGSSEDQKREVVINVWGSQFFGGDAGREVNNWVQSYQDGQNPGRARSRF